MSILDLYNPLIADRQRQIAAIERVIRTGDEELRRHTQDWNRRREELAARLQKVQTELADYQEKQKAEGDNQP